MNHVKEHRNDRADKFTTYVFVAGFVVMLFGCVAWAVTGRTQPAVRISITALWLMFAVLNGNAFYTGQFTWKGGPTFTREQSPCMFYLSAIFCGVGSMGIATFPLWAAYFRE